MEQLCLDQQEDVIASNQAMEAAKEKLVEAKGAAQASSEDAKAAQAMATELRDRVALLEADADIKASQQGIIEGLEVALAEARQAAASASADRGCSSPSGGPSGGRPRSRRCRAPGREGEDGDARGRPSGTGGDAAHRRREWCGRRRRAGDPAVRGAGAGAQVQGGPEGGAAEPAIMVEQGTLRTAAEAPDRGGGAAQGPDAATSAVRCENVVSPLCRDPQGTRRGDSASRGCGKRRTSRRGGKRGDVGQPRGGALARS